MAHLKKGEKRSKRKQQSDVLAAFEASANITMACKKARVSRRTFYNWLEEIDFKDKFDKAAKLGTGLLEDEAVRRATQGVTEPVYYKGKRVGGVKKYSDTLLIVLLKAHAPEKYKERFSGELSGVGGGPIKTQNIPLTPEEIKQYAATLEKEV
jgi:hypothetical protein